MASKEQKPFFLRGGIAGSASRQQYLTPDDVTNQGRFLLNSFLHDRLQRDGFENVPGLDQLQEPGTPKGPPMEHVREIARALKCIGDDLDRDQKLQELVTKVPPEAERQTLLNVASRIFEDGIFNWGRVVALFYFAYKVCVKALDRIPLIRAVINLIVEFMRDRVVQWILERGGWEAIREYFGSSGKQFALVIGAGVAACAGVLLYRNYLC
ncbi:unnamed protein product [Candidula unifasciata]|uniref:Bcl-2 Bcl-2 homology region 1-3 domain-containing protein n=1 Tax=Candidula unifasciata TaxID=100452 RepID=A0A8S3ZYX3_9EUPU|nr:unnamed protein product [Candidula unifasciata]